MKNLFVLALATAAFAAFLLAQDSLLPPSDLSSGIASVGYASQNGSAGFSKLLDWEIWLSKSLAQIAADSLAEAAVSAESCITRSRVLDIHLPAFARLLAVKADQLGRTGQTSLAKHYAALALEADPSSLSHIASFLRHGHGGIGQTVQQTIRAMGYFRSGLKGASHVTLWLSMLLAAWGTIFLAYAVARRMPRLVHLVVEIIPQQVPVRLRFLIACCFLFSLILVAGSFSLPLTAVLLAMGPAAFAIAKERVLLVVSALMVAAGSVGLSLGHRMMDAVGSGYLGLLDQANHSPWSQHLDSELARAQEQRPDDLKPSLAMALLADRSGRHQLASLRYRVLLDSRPDNGPALNNLGNVYFRLADYDSARFLYESALTADPSLAVAHYNLGQVHLRALRFSEGKRELEKASALDPGQVDERAARAGGGLVLDALLSNQVLWNNLWSGWKITEGFSRAESWKLSGPWSWMPALGGLALAVLFIVALVVWGKARPEASCQGCGAPVCTRCGGVEGHYCLSCADKVYAAQSPDIQDKVVKSLRPLAARRQLIRLSFANLLVPGSAWVVEDRLMAGWLWALLWAVVYATGQCWSLGLHPARAMQQFGIDWWPLAALAGLLWLLSWLPVLTRRQ